MTSPAPWPADALLPDPSAAAVLFRKHVREFYALADMPARLMLAAAGWPAWS